MSDARRALAGVRVLDLTDDHGAYAARLLRDLGAEVLRIELASAEPVWPAPTVEGGEGTVSLAERFVNAGKTIVDRGVLEEGDAEAAVGAADIVIERIGGLAELGISEEEVESLSPNLVRVTVSPYGADAGPDSADDLVVLGAGGLLHLGGYQDLGPVGAWGGQSTVAASVFAAVAALAGLLGRGDSDAAFVADVSAQEAIAQALEDSVAEFSLTGHARDRRGEQPQEAGTGIYPCADGYVSMVAGRLGTARAWAALVEWLIEEETPGAEQLVEEQWSDLAHRKSAEAIDAFAEIFGEFARSRTMESLYREAQRRAIALSPVNDLSGLMSDRQLEARGFFVEVDDEALGRQVTFPGPPYWLSATPALPPQTARRAGREAVVEFSGERVADG